jgi:hypothetical protein
MSTQSAVMFLKHSRKIVSLQTLTKDKRTACQGAVLYFVSAHNSDERQGRDSDVMTATVTTVITHSTTTDGRSSRGIQFILRKSTWEHFARS